MQNLYRLSNIMGLDTSNPQHSIALKEAMNGIVNTEEFLEYCRSQKDGIEYANRVEKLDTLSVRYKKTLNDIPTQRLEAFCKTLDSKFKEAIQALRNHEAYLRGKLSKLQVNGVQYFTDKEIELLDSVGTLNRLINLYELRTLYDELYENSVRKTIMKKNDMKLIRKNNVAAMISNSFQKA